jgi:hypothetical protein
MASLRQSLAVIAVVLLATSLQSASKPLLAGNERFKVESPTLQANWVAKKKPGSWSAAPPPIQYLPVPPVPATIGRQPAASAAPWRRRRL